MWNGGRIKEEKYDQTKKEHCVLYHGKNKRQGKFIDDLKIVCKTNAFVISSQKKLNAIQPLSFILVYSRIVQPQKRLICPKIAIKKVQLQSVHMYLVR